MKYINYKTLLSRQQLQLVTIMLLV